MKLEGKLPEIRLTAIILQGATQGHVRILGVKGGGNRPSAALRRPRKAKRRGGNRQGLRRETPRMPKARAA